jgi:hypothetical protein
VSHEYESSRWRLHCFAFGTLGPAGSHAGTSGTHPAGSGGQAGAPTDGIAGEVGTPSAGNGGEAGAPFDASGGEAGLAEGTTPSAISCLQILQCVGDCADGDTACAEACVASGSPDAQTKAGALADCITAQSCTDATCIQTQCTTTLSDCVSSSTPTPEGKPLEGTAPQGSVPADLVGTWTHVNFGETDRLVLNADGTGSTFIGIAGDAGGCVTLDSTTEAGTVVVTDTLISIYATKVTNLHKDCSAPSVTTDGDPLLVQYAWALKDPTTLITVSVDCAAMYPDSPGSVSFYCRNELTKE